MAHLGDHVREIAMKTHHQAVDRQTAAAIVVASAAQKALATLPVQF